MASETFFWLLAQADLRPASRAIMTAGRSKPTKTPMIEITTSSSTRVKPLFGLVFIDASLFIFVPFFFLTGPISASSPFNIGIFLPNPILIPVEKRGNQYFGWFGLDMDSCS
jgi:hypothetical protein